MNETDGRETAVNVEQKLAGIEQRLARIEMMLRLDESSEDEQRDTALPTRREGEFELAVGQNLFAKVGILVLAIGVALALSLP